MCLELQRTKLFTARESADFKATSYPDSEVVSLAHYIRTSNLVDVFAIKKSTRYLCEDNRFRADIILPVNWPAEGIEHTILNRRLAKIKLP